MRRRSLLPAALLAALALSALALPAPAHAQGLRDQIAQLFIFGPGQDPLFLAGSADPNNPASIRAHGDHFVPASALGNASVIAFITDAIGGNVANTPIGSTGGAETFRFEGGIPVPTSSSAGPIYAERAQTLGRGRMLAGISRSRFDFRSLRGVDLDDVRLVFTHENVDFPGCDSLQNGDCSEMGVPNLENDVMQVRLAMDIDVAVTALYLTYGLTDRIDVGAVVPVVSTTFEGRSEAQIQPFGGPTAAHFFAGTPDNPVLSATRTSQGSATGLGDVAVRMKINVRETPRGGFALLADARFPTGSEEDLLGSGSFMGRALAVFSATLGDVAPHANVGYLYRDSDRQNDAVLAAVGFDERVTDRVTLAADVLAELQVGANELELPHPVTYDTPFRRTVRPTEIPEKRDDIVNGSFGVKVRPTKGVVGILNALFPLNDGGLRAGVVYTMAAEFTF